MKYWNTSKKYREQSWIVVTIEYYHKLTPWDDMKLWCQHNGSKGRFYAPPYRRRLWYFEFSEDALAFKLRWTGPN